MSVNLSINQLQLQLYNRLRIESKKRFLFYIYQFSFCLSRRPKVPVHFGFSRHLKLFEMILLRTIVQINRANLFVLLN